jgi:hypothetical protein
MRRAGGTRQGWRIHRRHSKCDFECYAGALFSEDGRMSDWIVIYRTSPGTRETRSPSAPTERRALAQARTLHMQGCHVIRIKGPDDFLVPERRIENWVANGRDQLESAD